MTFSILLVIVLSLVVLGVLALVVRMAHRLPRRQPLAQDTRDFAAPLPVAIARDDRPDANRRSAA